MIQLFSTGRVDPTYKNIIAFSTPEQRATYFQGLPTITLTNCKYWRIGNTINIPISFNNAFIYDYARIINHLAEQEQEEYYCFVIGRTYVNDNLTMFAVSVDWVQTYYFSTLADGGKAPFYAVSSGFCSTTNNQNLMPPRGTVSEYPSPEVMAQSFIYNNVGNSVVIFSTVKLSDVGSIGVYASGYADGAILSAYPYLIYCEGEDLSVAAAKFQAVFNELNTKGLTDTVIGAYMIPNYFISGLSNGDIVAWSNSYIHDVIVTIQKPTKIGNYTPINSSLLGYDYTYITVNNGQGETEKYNFEDFDGIPEFTMSVSVASGSPVISCCPNNYKYGDNNERRQRMIKITQAPSVSWINDSYRIWLAQTQDSRRESIQAANLAIEQAKQARDNSFQYKLAGVVRNVEMDLHEPIANNWTKRFNFGGNVKSAINKASGLLSNIGINVPTIDHLSLFGDYPTYYSYGRANGAGAHIGDNGEITKNISVRDPDQIAQISRNEANNWLDLVYKGINNSIGIETTYTYDNAVINAQQNLDVLMASYTDKSRIPATASGSNAYGDLIKFRQYGFMFTVFSPTEEYARLIDNLLSANGHTVNQYVSRITKNHSTFDYYKFVYSLVPPNPNDRPEFARRLLMALLNNGVYFWYLDSGHKLTDKYGAPYGITNNEE